MPYTVGGTATSVDDYVSLGNSVTMQIGQSSAIVTVAPVDDTNSPEGDETVVLTLAIDAAYVVGISSAATVTIIDNDGADAFILGEQTAQGAVTLGSYLETLASDDNYEAITEELYGGNQRSRLDHQWTFDLAGASTWAFHLEAHHSVDDDDFVFAYSSDGTVWTDMVTVTKINDDDTTQTSFAILATGTVFVRVTDTDRSRGESGLDTLYVDGMFFTEG